MAKCSLIYVCSFDNCSASFSRRKRLVLHMRTHTGERPYVCKHEGCGKTYTRSQHLTRHMETHTRVKVKCEYPGCSQSFISANRLLDHKKKVHLKPEKPYKCSYCEKGFNKRNKKIVHESRHINVEPYKCEKEGCGKRFSTPSKLQRHMKVHGDQKCDKCDVSCPSRSLLLKHIRVCHPKEHKCSICSAVFAKAYNLKQHEKIHSSNSEELYYCPVDSCPRSYTLEKNLRYHVLHSHLERPFSCSHPGCAKSFKEEADLTKHMKIHDLNIPISSKKRKRKLKKKKKEQESYAAFLSGLNGESSDSEHLSKIVVSGHTAVNSEVEENNASSKKTTAGPENCMNGILSASNTSSLVTPVKDIDIPSSDAVCDKLNGHLLSNCSVEVAAN